MASQQDSLKVPAATSASPALTLSGKPKGKPGRKSQAELEAQRLARGDEPQTNETTKSNKSKKRPHEKDGTISGNEAERPQKSEHGVFVKDLVEIMYGCGDVLDPDPATLQLVDELLTDHLASLIAASMSVVPNKRDRLNPESFLYVMRQWPEKHAKCEQILAKYNDDTSSKKKKMRTDDTEPLNNSPRPTEQADHDES